MKQKIKKKYTQDCFAVLGFTVVLWVLQIYMITIIGKIAVDYIMRIVIIIAGMTAAAFATASSTAVLIHLRKNKAQIYLKEIMTFEHEQHGDLPH